jgi:hypothetical protein
MKAILLSCAEIAGATSRKDGSLGLRLVTGELTNEHRAILLELHGKNAKVLIEPIDDPDSEAPVEVKAERHVKSLSTRLYDVIYVYFKQLGVPGEFEDFRKVQMEKLISHYKSKLDPM